MRAAWIVLFVLSTMPLAGCNQYLERKDTIALSAGDAVASNVAIQTPDPWPREAYNTHIRSDGQAADVAYQRYAVDKVKRFQVQQSEEQVNVQPVFDPGTGLETSGGRSGAATNSSANAPSQAGGQ